MLDGLKEKAARLGKPAWRPMLRYVADLHGRSVRPPIGPLPQPWEEIGPGYYYAPAFGHWDIVHQILDALPQETAHARNQLLNDLALQRPDGMIQGCIFFAPDGTVRQGALAHPPVWPVAMEAYWEATGDSELLGRALEAASRQIQWFQANRAADGVGFYYEDLLSHRWESGVDEGVRYDDAPDTPRPCVDATSHLVGLCDHAARWAERLGGDGLPFALAAATAANYIRDQLFDDETGFFHDAWSVGDPQRRRLALEGMWPVATGAASPAQAGRVIDENLLNGERFFTAHPLATVAACDEKFELRMWRGPAWNSMTFWAARGCLWYDRPDAAAAILERALDASAAVFEKTGTIWEFYHPHGGDPMDLKRKPHTCNHPCRDYLGHNPLIAMADLWEQARGGAQAETARRNHEDPQGHEGKGTG